MKKYIFSCIILLRIFEIHGMGKPNSLKKDIPPVFIKKVTNNSSKIVRMLKSHYFGYITVSDMEQPLVTLHPNETKEWAPLLPMPYSSIHFLAQFHAVTLSVCGGYGDAPGSCTFNTCMLSYVMPTEVDSSCWVNKKLLRDCSYIVEILLSDRTRDGQVQFDNVEVIENQLT